MSRRSMVWVVVMTAVGCGVDQGAGPFPLPRCVDHVVKLALTAGQYQSIAADTPAGCVAFPRNASVSDSTEYLVIAQAATGVPGATATFSLAGERAWPPASAAAVPPQAAATSLPQRFHDRLRDMET